jgi:hypothetical protein
VNIQILLEETAHPDRPDIPADEPAIAALMRIGGGNEYAMLPTLLSPHQHPSYVRTAQREAQAL